ncbi:hypothetical protein [Moheibacter sediminis]|uniref:Lipoprotein n=1 Tax=Moheibacter sediminis TaxID=1434700 RepID=A0A1W2A9N1_9FLAO|nr:hypothetical protein [Moheibacter sediminis]SMC57293.1 hypothetical protein SAMN06296427_10441 [Moheibacter sediminis]
MRLIIFLFLFILISCGKEEVKKADHKEESKTIQKSEVVDSIFNDILVKLDSINQNDSTQILKKPRLIGLKINPPLWEVHEIIVNTESNYLIFNQITDRSRFELPAYSYQLTDEEKEKYIELQKKLHYSKNFTTEINQKEVNEIQNLIDNLKEEDYKDNLVEMMDGYTYVFTLVGEKSIAQFKTNKPSEVQIRLIKLILLLSGKYAKDSATKKNIEIFNKDL